MAHPEASPTELPLVLILARDSYEIRRPDLDTLHRKHLSGRFRFRLVQPRRAPGPKLHPGASGGDTYAPYHGPGFLGRLRAAASWPWTLLQAVTDGLRSGMSGLVCRDLLISFPFVFLFCRASGVPAIYWRSYPMELGYLDRARRNFHNRRPLPALGQFAIGAMGVLALKFLLPRADFVIVQSDRMKQRVAQDYRVPSQRISAIPMGVDDSLIDQDISTDGIPDHLRFILSGKTVLYVGTLDRSRALEVPAAAVAEICAAHKDVRFVCLGSHSGEERQALADVFAATPGAGEILFFDAIPLASLLACMRYSTVCLAPYPAHNPLLDVATPTKLVEYLAAGGRVVANRHPDQTYVLQSANTGWLCDFDQADFKRAISEALSEPAISDAERRRCTEWVLSNRSYGVLSKQVELLYRSAFNI